MAYKGTPNDRGFTSSTGYKITKFDNKSLSDTEVLAPNNPTDSPIFWFAEALLNYAEAAAEIEEITQTDLDNTVNLLRQRANVAPLQLSAIPNDPKRETDIAPLLWEIRRERRSELMMDGFREWDIRRWGKLSYLDPEIKPDIFRGAHVPAQTALGAAVDSEGYILPYGLTTEREVISPRNYLEAIPTGEIILYQLKGVDFPQNIGW